MKKVVFKGAGCAIVTPFTKEGGVNYDKLAELVEFQIAGGTDAIIVAGTTGESPTLTPEEHSDVIRFVVETTKKRIPVVAGTGSNDTRFAVAHCEKAERDGADALLMVTPYYNKTSQRGLVEHYKAVASSVDLPIILYNVPSRTGLNIKPETYYELAKIDNIVATKEANSNIAEIVETRSLCGDALGLYSGNDDQIVPLMSVGALGVISVLSNIMPKETHEICQKCFENKFDEAAALQFKLMKLVGLLFADVNPIPVKKALNLMGFEVGDVRLPLFETTEQIADRLAAEIKKQGLIN